MFYRLVRVGVHPGRPYSTYQTLDGTDIRLKEYYCYTVMPILTLRVTNTNQMELLQYFKDKNISSYVVIGQTERGTKNEQEHYHSVIWLHDYKHNSLVKDLKRKGITKAGNENHGTASVKEDDIVEISRLVKYSCKEGLFATTHPEYNIEWISNNPYTGTPKATKEETFLQQIDAAFKIYLAEKWPNPYIKPTVKDSTKWIIQYHMDRAIFDKYRIDRFYNYLMFKYVDEDLITNNILTYIQHN